MSEPLTPEEEAAVRAGFLHPGIEQLVDRLLATLDAARAASPDDERLREASEEYMEAVEAYLDPQNQYTDSRLRAVVRTGAALRAQLDREAGR